MVLCHHCTTVSYRQGTIVAPSVWLLLLLLPIPTPLSLQDKIVISEDEVITNNGDTKVLPYKTRKSFWGQHWGLCCCHVFGAWQQERPS